MKILAIIKKDLRTNFRDKIKFLSLLVAVLLPLAYGFLYLWAFWNPYENMKNVAVAVVNEDEGSDFKGKKQELGKDIVDELKKNEVLKWDFVSREDASKGLDSQKYYALLLIPSDFSKNLVSAGGDDPQQAKISWQTRDSTNFIFTTYFKNVAAALEENINGKILPQFADEAGIKVEELAGNLDAASSGAQQLSSGLEQLKNGSETIENNLGKAENGSQQLASGLGTLDSKSADLTGGIVQARTGAASLSTGLESANSGIKSLNIGLGKLDSGADKLKSGSGKLASGARTLANGSSEMYNKLDGANESLSPFYPYLNGLSDKIDQANSDNSLNIPNYVSYAKEQKDNLISGSKQIANGSETLAENMSDLNEGIGTLQTGISSAKSGAETLQNGIGQLSTGSTQLSSGLGDIYTGTQQYTGGVNSAYSGSKELSSGLAQLEDGSGTLTNGIANAQAGADILGKKLSEGSGTLKQELNKEKISRLVAVINEPVMFENDSAGANKTYGAGFAPYFIPLALWMGALILTLLVPVRDPKLNISGVSRTGIMLGKFFLLASVGICQASVLSLSVIYGLGLEAKYPLRLVLFCILISLAFISIMQFMSFAFGKVGELLGILLLMIQLTSASGTFPVESSPRFFQVCSPLVPMSYAVRGIRLLILGGQMQIVRTQALALAGFLVIFLALKTITTRKTISATDIYPLIEI